MSLNLPEAARWHLVTGLFQLAWHNALENYPQYPGNLTEKDHYTLWKEHEANFESVMKAEGNELTSSQSETVVGFSEYFTS